MFVGLRNQICGFDGQEKPFVLCHQPTFWKTHTHRDSHARRGGDSSEKRCVALDFAAVVMELLAVEEEWEKKMIAEPEPDPLREEVLEESEVCEQSVVVQKPARRHSSIIMKHGLELLEDPVEEIPASRW
jgi:hypothetical protein